MATVAKAPEFDPQSVNEQPSLQKETAVEQPKKYYMSELAALIGVDAKVLSNAKYSRGTPRPGSNIHFVVEKMKELGITWENVVPACRREYANSARSVPMRILDLSRWTRQGIAPRRNRRLQPTCPKMGLLRRRPPTIRQIVTAATAKHGPCRLNLSSQS